VAARVFIASSGKHVLLARAIQTNLDDDQLHTTVWDQDVFKPSQYPLDALAVALDESDYGVFVLAPDDLARVAGAETMVPRDNVVFELGFFAGRLGYRRTFAVAPKDLGQIHLPSDLAGLTLATYDSTRVSRDVVGALGKACNKIRTAIAESSLATRPGILRAGMFEDFTNEFDNLIDECTNMTTFFIHSRRWRENHNERLRQFLSRADSSWLAFLPDTRDKQLMRWIREHFNDGPSIPGLIKDAYRFFAALKDSYDDRVRVRLLTLYPTYSFYLFGHVAVLAMYPATAEKQPVPTLKITGDGRYGQFVQRDIDALVRVSRLASARDLRQRAPVPRSA